MKRIKQLVLWGIAGAVIGLLLIQLVPYGRTHENPPVLGEPNWNSPETRALAQRACYDCHSNEVDWTPWYTNVAPASWLVQRDVEEGREHLNFSEWDQGGRPRELEEVVEVIAEGEMPPLQYLVAHPEARLSDAEQAALMRGLQNSFTP
ncbi:MAG: heme-binding domain-containing protein [Anaerolineales bacterium]|nr:heme-binding domain-containing protein [Anaerolineales bacterium]